MRLFDIFGASIFSCFALILAGATLIFPNSHTAALIGQISFGLGVIGLAGTLVAAASGSRQRRVHTPVPDITLHEAADYIVNDSRTRLRTAPTGYDLAPNTVWVGEQHNDALERLRQQVGLGTIKVWGQKQIGEPSSMTFETSLSEIPKNYWDTADFNWEFCKHQSNEPQTCRLGGKGEALLYKRLTLNRSQIMAVWPRKKTWVHIFMPWKKPIRINAGF